LISCFNFIHAAAAAAVIIYPSHRLVISFVEGVVAEGRSLLLYNRVTGDLTDSLWSWKKSQSDPQSSRTEVNFTMMAMKTKSNV
jgi:hypothetical protein